MTRDSEFPTTAEALEDLSQRVKALESAMDDHQHKILDKLKRFTAPVELHCRHRWVMDDASPISEYDTRFVHCTACHEVGRLKFDVRLGLFTHSDGGGTDD